MQTTKNEHIDEAPKERTSTVGTRGPQKYSDEFQAATKRWFVTGDQELTETEFAVIEREDPELGASLRPMWESARHAKAKWTKRSFDERLEQAQQKQQPEQPQPPAKKPPRSLLERVDFDVFMAAFDHMVEHGCDTTIKGDGERARYEVPAVWMTYVKRHFHAAVPLALFHKLAFNVAELIVMARIATKWMGETNEKNRERNDRIAALEARVKTLEERQ